MTYEVYLAERAQKDLAAAHDYIARYAPETAELWHANFLRSLLKLEKNPESRPSAPENGEFPFHLRQYTFRGKSGKANRALFAIVGDQVRVLAIRRPGQPLVTPEDIGVL